MAFSIEHVTIRVRDMEASVDYYQRMFGGQVILRRNLAGGKKITFLRIGESMLELMALGPANEPVDSREHYGVHHIGIKTDNFEATYKDLKAKGAEGVVLGCTELPLLIKQPDLDIPVFDTTLLHAMAAVDAALKD